MEQELALRPFVPAKDFGLSKEFYQALGFTMTLEDESIAMMKLGSFSFILQDFYIKELAGNFMLQLMVRNVDVWWERMESARLAERFGVKPPQAPKMQPWGMKVGFIFDPSLVLWHIAESLF